jgi:hypothetical protein
MWFLLLTFGAVLLATLGLPALGRLPVAPPAEVAIAAYFLFAALVRLLVRRVRLAAWERAARKRARLAPPGQPAAAKPSSGLADLGLGVGKGVAQVVGGDLLGAGISVATGLLKGAAASLGAGRAKGEKRPPVRREAARALGCIAAVGAVCVVVAWLPMPRGAARAAGREGLAWAASVVPIARARAAELRGAETAPRLAAATAPPPAGPAAAVEVVPAAVEPIAAPELMPAAEPEAAVPVAAGAAVATGATAAPAEEPPVPAPTGDPAEQRERAME